MTRPMRFRDALKAISNDDMSLQAWMLENYVALLARYPKGRLKLRELAPICRDLKLTNAQGGPPSDAVISKTWGRVREQKAIEAASHGTRPDEFPPGVRRLPEALPRPRDRIEADETDFEVSPPPAPRPQPSRPITPALSSSGYGGRILTVAEKLNRVVREIRDAHPQMPSHEKRS